VVLGIEGDIEVLFFPPTPFDNSSLSVVWI
jgi:hypothetical protein